MKSPTRLPKRIVGSVVLLCILPTLLNLVGIRFSFIEHELFIEDNGMIIRTVDQSGRLVYTLLEWTACCLAVITAIFALIHYRLKQDVTTPIVGTALFFAAMIDAFTILASDRLITTPETAMNNFIPFTWMISRMFHACILIAGTIPFLWQRPTLPPKHNPRGLRFIILAGLLYGLMAYAIIHVCAVSPKLPEALNSDPDVWLHRRWDVLPMVMYLFAGIFIFPRFHKLNASLFSHGLMISVLPHVSAQFHAAFGSLALYDNHFNIASFLKIVGYLVPLMGLLLDYTYAYQSESALRATQEKLRFARQVQLGLFPQQAPQINGFEVAGLSLPADATGGDYFDYLDMKHGRHGIVVADVSGHEIGASLLMAQTRAYLRALVRSHDDIGQVASHLNDFICNDANTKMFVTMVLAQITPDQNTLNYATLGHEAHLIRSDNSVEILTSVNPPLGVIDDAEIPCKNVELKDQELLLIVTDGVSESVSADGNLFGSERMLQCVTRNKKLTCEEIAERLHQEVQEFRQSAVQADDLTIVIVKKTAS